MIFLASSLVSCIQKKSFSKVHDSKNYVSVKNISRIENYDKEKIEISGKFYMDFENIYLEKDEQKIWLNFDFHPLIQTEGNEVLDAEMLKNFNNKVIKIKGKLSVGKKGHLGSYKAELNDIVSFEN